MSNASISASMLSVDFPDEESAYGSNSGKFLLPFRVQNPPNFESDFKVGVRRGRVEGMARDTTSMLA
jgi:hypothetical protein